MKLSIIIVHYKATDQLLECLKSIYASSSTSSYEIILVDNDEKKIISPQLQADFPSVHYVPNTNKGFGQGNNTGARIAKGTYLFFLNPDTVVLPGAIDELIHFLDTHKKVGIVAPLLLTPEKKPYAMQGTGLLTPLRGIFVLSIINRFLPKNAISKGYWLEWDKTEEKEVATVPGTAFMIRNDIFKKLNGFDEHFFLYFEESDLCKRVAELHHKLYIIPQSKIIHFWGRGGTQFAKNKKRIFQQSRFYYFKKHYGVIVALIVEVFARIDKWILGGLLLLILFGLIFFLL